MITGSGWRPSAVACDAFKYPGCERHVRSAPYVSLLEGPGVDRVAIANQLDQAWFAELLGGPLIQALQPRHDHRVVEHPTKTLLIGDIALHVARERIAVRQHAAEGEEDAGHPHPGVAEQAAERSEPSERQARRRGECVRVQHTC